MRILCFSLWGTNDKYTIGAIENAKLAKIIYPDWKCKFYVGNDVTQDTELELLKHGCIIEKMDDTGLIGLFWRFYGMGDDVECFMSRDADSRLNLREKAAVDEWIDSGKSFHIMKDHKCHQNNKIMGGMFGCKGGMFKNIKNMIDEYVANKEISYGIDQQFLKDKIYPIIKDDNFTHDLYSKWPVDRIDGDHVGSIYNNKNIRITSFVGININ